MGWEGRMQTAHCDGTAIKTIPIQAFSHIQCPNQIPSLVASLHQCLSLPPQRSPQPLPITSLLGWVKPTCLYHPGHLVLPLCSCQGLRLMRKLPLPQVAPLSKGQPTQKTEYNPPKSTWRRGEMAQMHFGLFWKGRHIAHRETHTHSFRNKLPSSPPKV